MRNLIWITFILLALTSCNRTAKKGGELSERDSLKMELGIKDSLLNEVFASLGDITSNLTEIKTRENIITSAVESAEIHKEPTLRISEDIAAIDELLQQNRETIKRLESSAAQLKKAKVKVSALEKLIAEMTAQVESKNSEIAIMKRELSQMKYDVETLTVHAADLSSTLGSVKKDKERLESEVDGSNERFYIVGARKELISKKIVYKSGFIGRTLKFNENHNMENFTKVDGRTFDKVLIGQKGVEFVTSHPEGSYEIVMDDKGVYQSLKIVDSKKFWEFSTVLIISYK